MSKLFRLYLKRSWNRSLIPTPESPRSDAGSLYNSEANDSLARVLIRVFIAEGIEREMAIFTDFGRVV